MTEPRVATLGLTPAVPAMKKYVDVRSNFPEYTNALIVDASFTDFLDKEYSTNLRS